MQRMGIFYRISMQTMLVIDTILVASCASSTRTTAPNDAKNEVVSTQTAWAGRLSLQVQSPSENVAAQSFAASFELKGQPESGELTLISPLGSILGVMRWTPDEAVFDAGNGKLQRYLSVESFLAETTGAAVPMAALFGWLRGQDTGAAGWTVDLSRHSDGRIAARRNSPAPQADLRLVLDQ